MKYNNNAESAYVPDALFVDAAFPVLTKGVALKAVQGTLKRGSVICKNATGEYVLGSTTDSTRVIGVLADDATTATAGTDTTIATVYRTGHFNKALLKFAEGTTFESMEIALAGMGIYASGIREE